jgi:phosphatidate cytidylyltransferase
MLGSLAVTGSQPSLPNSTAGQIELPARAASAIVMGMAAVGAVYSGGRVFPVIVAAGAIAALREWHRLINGGRIAREMIPTGLAMIAAVFLAHQEGALPIAFLAIALGAVCAALSAALRRPSVSWPIPWHAFGAVYVGLSVVALVLLRDEPRGSAIVGGLFVAVWTADTAALLLGRLIGGPKLAPDLSPNKTWAGFVGGTLAAGAAEAVYVFFSSAVPGAVLEGALFGIILALAGHFGDLFESWVKRQFRAKNTGKLIPGHGGMLDRIDSLLFAAPVCTALIYLAGFNPWLGGAS